MEKLLETHLIKTQAKSPKIKIQDLKAVTKSLELMLLKNLQFFLTV